MRFIWCHFMLFSEWLLVIHAVSTIHFFISLSWDVIHLIDIIANARRKISVSHQNVAKCTAMFHTLCVLHSSAKVHLPMGIFARAGIGNESTWNTMKTNNIFILIFRDRWACRIHRARAFKNVYNSQTCIHIRRVNVKRFWWYTQLLNRIAYSE